MSTPPAAAVPFPNSYWVIPGRFLAGEHPAAAEMEIFQQKLAALLDAGIRTFVDLTEPFDMGHDGAVMIAYRRLLKALAAERELAITQVNIPIPDFSVPSPDTMRCVLDVIDGAIAREQPVFVHCMMGIGRTGTAVGCYLKRRGLATDADVMERIAALRQCIAGSWCPSPHTTEQIEMVEQWRAGE